jgi:hypothetical protein
MLGIRWDDFVSNAEVLERTGLASVEALIEETQLRWLGHIRRMDEKEFLKIVLYGELSGGSRSADGQKKSYKDHIRAVLAKPYLLATWEQLAEDRNDQTC